MKVGFVAMSGLRAVNPRLNELGLTLPGFIERKQKPSPLCQVWGC